MGGGKKRARRNTTPTEKAMSGRPFRMIEASLHT
ncbi:MAG: hypothetical protein RL711_1821, partial [Bacteroidota bacterium]